MGARHFGAVEETTVGTWEAPDHFFEAVSESVQLERNSESLETIRAFTIQQINELNTIVRGDVEMVANYDGTALLFKHLIGSVDSTTGGVAAFDHTIPASTGIPAADRVGLGLSLEFRRDGSLVWRYAGCKITGLTHEMNADATSRLSFGFLGQTETTSASPTSASFPTLLPALPSHVTVTFGSNVMVARSVSLTVENPLDEPFILGQTTVGLEPDRSGALKITATMEGFFTNWTAFYNDFSAFNDVDIAIGASNDTEGILYNIDKAKILQATPHNEGRDRLVATVEIEGYHSTTAVPGIQIIVSNNDTNP